MKKTLFKRIDTHLTKISQPRHKLKVGDVYFDSVDPKYDLGGFMITNLTKKHIHVIYFDIDKDDNILRHTEDSLDRKIHYRNLGLKCVDEELQQDIAKVIKLLTV